MRSRPEGGSTTFVILSRRGDSTNPRSWTTDRRQAVAGDDENAPGRTRTCNLRIRSPLLYPLSYGRKRLLFPGVLTSSADLLEWNVTPAFDTCLPNWPPDGRTSEGRDIDLKRRPIPHHILLRNGSRANRIRTFRCSHMPPGGGRKKSKASSATSALGTIGGARSIGSTHRRPISTLAGPRGYRAVR